MVEGLSERWWAFSPECYVINIWQHVRVVIKTFQCARICKCLLHQVGGLEAIYAQANTAKHDYYTVVTTEMELRICKQ